MTYSRRDLDEAFDCVEEQTAGVSITVPTFCREKVLQHLDGTCACERNRCQHCRRRPRNKIPNHASDCPMALARV